MSFTLGARIEDIELVVEGEGETAVTSGFTGAVGALERAASVKRASLTVTKREKKAALVRAASVRKGK